MNKEMVLQFFSSDVDFRVTKVLKQHWHKSKFSYLSSPRPDYGLMLLSRGSVDFLTASGTVSAHSGNLVFLSKNSRYEAVFAGEADNYLICFDADFNMFLPSDPIVLIKNTDLACFEKIRVLVEENRRTERSKLYNKGAFFLLLDSVAEAAGNEGNNHSDIIKYACELMQKDPKLSIEQIAKECAVSTSLFRQVFIKKIGVSPRRYRMDMKLKQAIYLIESTDMTIGEIAESLSFFDTAYFCKVFKAHIGMTPKEYAKNKKF